MNFHSSIPFYLTNLKTSIQEVRSGIRIVVAGTQNNQLFALIRQQICFIKILVLPDIVK